MAGTRKKSTRKAKAKVQPKDRSPPGEVEVVEVAPEVGTVESVAEAAKEFVEEMTSTKPEEPREEKAEAPVVEDKPAAMEVVEDVVQVQEEDTPVVSEEKEKEKEAEEPPLTMEERKKKLDLLRKRMVSCSSKRSLSVIADLSSQVSSFTPSIARLRSTKPDRSDRGVNKAEDISKGAGPPRKAAKTRRSASNQSRGGGAW